MVTCATLARDNVLAYGVHVTDYSYRYFIVSLMLFCISTLFVRAATYSKRTESYIFVCIKFAMFYCAFQLVFVCANTL